MDHHRLRYSADQFRAPLRGTQTFTLTHTINILFFLEFA